MLIFDLFIDIWNIILNMLGFGQRNSITKPDLLKVFIRTNIGEQVCVTLEPSWTVSQIKSQLSGILSSPEKELKIIFAGKELTDDLLIQQCDLGNNSILHAVRVVSPRDSHPTIDLESHCKNNTSSKNEELTEVNHTNEKKGIATNSSVQKNLRAANLLCDPSTVMSIQLSGAELNHIWQLKAEASEQIKPYFYIYCVHPCASVQIGKLRVRCAECKEGALTLMRDPSSWSDVLHPYQVSSTCESPGCEGNFAEFFFKCKEHETTGTDDTAVALYLVKSNIRGISCLACMDVSTPIVVFQCTSAHVICLECFITYCASRLNERQFVNDNKLGYTLPCPLGCSDSLIKEVHHFKLMGGHQYERYQRFATEEAVFAAGGVLCPQPGCGQGIIPDKDCRRVACIAGCGYVFCKDCLQGYHIGECHPNEIHNIDQASYQGFFFDPKRATRSKWEDPSNLAIRKLTKPCPKCRTATERDGGCMHMVCTRTSCQFNWCWVCQTEWTRECMAAHWFG